MSHNHLTRLKIENYLDERLSDEARRAVETQQFRAIVAIQRVTGAGQSRGAERHYVHATCAIAEPVRIAQQHFKPRQHVVAKGNRLRGL